MDVIQNVFWRTRSTATARSWPFAKSVGYVCPLLPWTSCPKSGPLSSGKEAGVSGHLRPQLGGGYLRYGQDRIWPGSRHGMSTRNCCLYHWCCRATLEPHQVDKGNACLVLLLVDSRYLLGLWSRTYVCGKPLCAASIELSASCRQTKTQSGMNSTLKRCASIFSNMLWGA